MSEIDDAMKVHASLRSGTELATLCERSHADMLANNLLAVVLHEASNPVHRWCAKGGGCVVCDAAVAVVEHAKRRATR